MVPSRRQARTLARGLGWFSIGLGVVELLTAKPLARAVGAPRRSGLVSLSGVFDVSDRLALDVSVTNALDNEYNAFFGNEARVTHATPGAPRHVRVTLRSRF